MDNPDEVTKATTQIGVLLDGPVVSAETVSPPVIQKFDSIRFDKVVDIKPLINFHPYKARFALVGREIDCPQMILRWRCLEILEVFAEVLVNPPVGSLTSARAIRDVFAILAVMISRLVTIDTKL